MRKASAAVAATLACIAGVATAAPAQAQLPAGSMEMPATIDVPVPFGSAEAQLPPLPAPFRWVGGTPSQPQYVASNWVEMWTWCHSPGEWAYTEDGTVAWCSRRERTEAYMWAPTNGVLPTASWWPTKETRVENSLTTKPCPREGDEVINPSNGQLLQCQTWMLERGDGTYWYVKGGR